MPLALQRVAAPASVECAKNAMGQILDQLREIEASSLPQRLDDDPSSQEAIDLLLDTAAGMTHTNASESLALSDSLLRVCQRLGSARQQARAYRLRARALAYCNRFEEALAACHEGIAKAESVQDQIEAARLRLASMHALGELGRLDEAISAGETARESLLDAGEPALAARADINLGGAYQRRGQIDRALVCLDRAKPLLVGEDQMTAMVESNRGEALVALCDFPAAEVAFKAALSAAENSGAALTAAIYQGNLADLATRRGRLDQALRQFERARRRLEGDAARGHLARMQAEQADAMSVLGMPREALPEYQAALSELDRCGLTLEAARARSGMGLALLRLGEYAGAETALSAAANAFNELGHATARAKVDLVRAELALNNGRLAEARSMVLHALAALHDRPAESAAARYLLAKLAIQMKRPAEAEGDLAAGLAQAKQLNLPPLLADLLHLRGLLRKQQNRLDEAISDFGWAIEQVERVRGSLQAQRFRAAWLGGRATLFEDLVAVLLERGNEHDAQRAFEVAEQAKSRSLLEHVRGIIESAATDLDDGESLVLKQLSDVRGELNALYSRLGDHKQRSSAAATDDLASWRVAVRQREQELDGLERRLGATGRIGGLYASTITASDAMALVEPDSAIVEYFIADAAFVAFVVTSEGVTAHRLAAVADVVQQVERVQFQINRALRPGALMAGSSDQRSQSLCVQMRRELQRLYELILAPLIDRVDAGKTLTIVPHGALHLVPFVALWDGEEYLVRRFTINLMPSSGLLAESTKWRAKSGKTHHRSDALVIGVADEHAPNIEAEARALARTLGCDERNLLIGEQATVNNVIARMADARLIHMACHGRFAADTPLGAGLKLADRLLTVRDLLSSQMSARLVTLSACETGVSAVQAGDELFGLLRGFFAAGALSLLVSLWRVHDEVTGQFMGEFYRLLRDSRAPSVAAALREAQLRLMETHEHPAMWAPFVLVGTDT